MCGIASFARNAVCCSRRLLKLVSRLNGRLTPSAHTSEQPYRRQLDNGLLTSV